MKCWENLINFIYICFLYIKYFIKKIFILKYVILNDLKKLNFLDLLI